MYTNQQIRDHRVLKGRVCYQDGSFAQGVTVILEEYTYSHHEKNGTFTPIVIERRYMQTDCEGEYFFRIDRLNHYYRVKVFEVIKGDYPVSTCNISL